MPTGPSWPTQPPPGIAALPFPDGWTADPSLSPAVVNRAVQLLNAGMRSPATSPSLAPISTRRLEFVGGQWVMFIPYTDQPNGVDMVVAWVPKSGYSAEADSEEHEPPPAGAPAAAPAPGVSGVGFAPHPSDGFLSYRDAVALQAQINYLMAIARGGVPGGQIPPPAIGGCTDDLTPAEVKAELGGELGD